LAARQLALLHVAIYDAMIAAWDSKYAFKRPHPSEVDASLTTVTANPRSPSYPSEHAVAAGAASTVLAYVFPDRAAFFGKKADEAVASRLYAGVAYRSDVVAGLQLGRRVAELVIEHAKGDGTDAKWTGSVPTGHGKWNGTNPVLPQAATWKPWILSTPGEFRSAPPIAFDSAERAAELAELKIFPRTPKTNSDAAFWEYAAGGRRNFQYWDQTLNALIFEYQLEFSPPRAARAYALLWTTYYDAGVACWDSKYTYWMIRPFQADPDLKPVFATSNHPSYPAAHGCLSHAAAGMLGYLFPRAADTLTALADEANLSRIAAGIHYRSDTIAGRKLGLAVAEKAIARAKSDGSE
jgi:membrane-associated phospholipid phosphatase